MNQIHKDKIFTLVSLFSFEFENEGGFNNLNKNYLIKSQFLLVFRFQLQKI